MNLAPATQSQRRFRWVINSQIDLRNFATRKGAVVLDRERHVESAICIAFQRKVRVCEVGIGQPVAELKKRRNFLGIVPSIAYIQFFGIDRVLGNNARVTPGWRISVPYRKRKR